MERKTYERWRAIARKIARAWVEDSWSSTDNRPEVERGKAAAKRELFTSNPEAFGQAGLDLCIRLGHCKGMTPEQIAKLLPLPECDEDLKIRYVKAKVCQIELEGYTECTTEEDSR